jgi:ABC-type transport system involved in multi-copper enzyme maturation permease subunit
MSHPRLLRHPLLIKELRTRLRSRMAVLMISLYVLGLGAAAFLFFLASGGFGLAMGSTIGVGLFRAVGYVQLWIIILVCPLLAAASVCGEKDQNTYDSLVVAPLSVRAILLTKYAAVASYFFALLLLSLPVLSVSFIMGGVSPVAIVELVVALLVTVLFTGSIGIFWSTRFNRSIAAIPVACISTFALSLGFASVTGTMGGSDQTIVGLLSPILLVERILGQQSIAIFGGHCSAVIPGGIIALGATALLFRGGELNLEFPQERRYVLFRALGLFCMLSIFLFMAAAVKGIDPEQQLQFIARGAEAAPPPPLLPFVPLLIALLAALVVMAPWYGASTKVRHSESLTHAGADYPSLQQLRRWLTGSCRYLLTVAGIATIIALTAMGYRGVPPVLLGKTALMLATTILMPMALLCLLTRLLAGDGGPIRRWVALGSGYLLALLHLIASPIIEATAGYGRGPAPLWRDLLHVMTPSWGLQWMSAFYQRKSLLPALTRALDGRNPLVVPAVIYGLLALCLLALLLRQRTRRTRLSA